MEHARNITLRLPVEVVKRAKVMAAERETSVSKLVATALLDFENRSEERNATRRRFFEAMEGATDLGTHGKPTWTREELHDREKAREGIR